jgi:hypothetical protein
VGPGRLGGRRPRGGPLLRDPDAPFTGPDADAIREWADGRLDVSDPVVWATAPRAIVAILAREWGWEAVRGPGPVTFEEAVLYLQLIAEERIGTVIRERARMARAAEDAAFAAVAAASGGSGANR